MVRVSQRGNRSNDLDPRLQELLSEESDVDLERWFHLDSWSIEEAVAVAIGKDPAVLHLTSANRFADQSNIAARFCWLIDAAERAVDVKRIRNPVSPKQFQSWIIGRQHECCDRFRAFCAFESPFGELEFLRKRNDELEALDQDFQRYKSALRIVCGLAQVYFKWDPHNQAPKFISSLALKLPPPFDVRDDALRHVFEAARDKLSKEFEELRKKPIATGRKPIG